MLRTVRVFAHPWALMLVVLLPTGSTAFSTAANDRFQFHRSLGVSIPTRRFASDVAKTAAPMDAPPAEDEACPRGYFLNSVKEQCSPLGPLGRVSQVVETWGPIRMAYKTISNLFGVDTNKISGLGVGFALSYAILSTINGAISLSFAWYLSCRRVSAWRFVLLHESTGLPL
jgi:hypothetical protein